MSSLISTLSNFRTGIQNLREKHPKAVRNAALGLMVTGTLVLSPAVIAGGLNVVGFTPSGVAGGSIAAGVQSSLYKGLTCGLFSNLQSIGMTQWGGVGICSVLTGLGIGSFSAGALLRPASHRTETSGSASLPDHPAGSNRT